MKKLKLMLITLSILFALSGAIAPIQIVRAEDGGSQGTSDSQRRSTSQEAKAAELWAAIMRLLGW
jgi:hypothetical protein